MNKDISFGPDQFLSAPLLAIEQLGHQLGHSLIVAPHPDDEALGCGGLISYLRSQNMQVTIIFMTSGGASHPNSLQYTPQLLASLREKEALKSCKILGVNSDDVFFYRYPDGVLESYGEEKLAEIAEQLSLLIEDREIASLFLPWRRDVHPDHLLTNSIGFEAIQKCKNAVQIVEYPIWLWKNSKKEDWPQENEVFPFRLNVDAVLSQKREAVFEHQSQTTDLIKDDLSGFRLTDDLLSPFLGPYEIYFFSKDKKMDALDKHFFDALYSDNADPWNFKHSEYELSKYQKTDEIIGNKHFNKGLELGCSIGIQTRFFARHCDQLLAVDISKDAVANAINNNDDLLNVKFQVQDISEEFPPGPFEFISMCEIGYYFDKITLMEIFKKMSKNLAKNGEFLMVHWTSFVREYPLNGTQINEIFKEFNAVENQFSCISSYTHERYEIKIWKKN